MTIAEKLSRAKDDIDAVYEAGYGKGYADGGGGNNSGGSAIDEEVNTQAELIAEIKKTAESLPDVGSGGDSGGGSDGDFDYIAYWDEMLGDKYKYVETDIDSLTPTCTFVREFNSKRCYIVPEGCFGQDYNMNDVYDLLVIPRTITQIAEFAFDNAPWCTVVCLAPTPPDLGWQGYWSADGGMSPPTIYVLDDSVDAYKEETTWAEYADRVHPLSEFNYSEV